MCQIAYQVVSCVPVSDSLPGGGLCATHVSVHFSSAGQVLTYLNYLGRSNQVNYLSLFLIVLFNLAVIIGNNLQFLLLKVICLSNVMFINKNSL